MGWRSAWLQYARQPDFTIIYWICEGLYDALGRGESLANLLQASLQFELSPGRSECRFKAHVDEILFPLDKENQVCIRCRA